MLCRRWLILAAFNLYDSHWLHYYLDFLFLGFIFFFVKFKLQQITRLPQITRFHRGGEGWVGTPSCYVGYVGGMPYTTWYHLMYWYDMIWYDMIPDNVIWCQWIICCTIWCSLVFIYLLVFDIHIDYLTWPYYHLINEYWLKKCTAEFKVGIMAPLPKYGVIFDFLGP